MNNSRVRLDPAEQVADCGTSSEVSLHHGPCTCNTPRCSVLHSDHGPGTCDNRWNHTGAVHEPDTRPSTKETATCHSDGTSDG